MHIYSAQKKCKNRAYFAMKYDFNEEYKRAEKLIEQGHWEDAIELHKLLASNFPNNSAWTYERIGFCYEKMGRTDKAIENYRAAYEQKAKEATNKLVKIKSHVRKSIESVRLALHESMMGYWRSTGEPPEFLLDGISPEVPNSAFENCKVLWNRTHILEHMPKAAIVAELGTQKGLNAQDISHICEPKELHLFDLKYDLFVHDAHRERLDNKTTILHEGDSSTLLSEFDDEFFDWIYIDGDHSYPGVIKDIQVAEKKIKANGYLIFNDYTPWSVLEAMPYGVYAAVNELLCKDEWEAVFLSLHYHGYNDIALRKRS